MPERFDASNTHPSLSEKSRELWKRAEGAVEERWVPLPEQPKSQLVGTCDLPFSLYLQSSTTTMQIQMMTSQSQSLTTSTIPSSQWTQLRPERCNAKRIDNSVELQDVQEIQNQQLQWQSTSHLSGRRTMVQRILQLSQSHSKPNVNPDRAVLLAKRIELALYSRAGSLTEYCNLATLRRRLQSLVAFSMHEAVASETVVQTRKRHVMSQNLMRVTRLTKRQRCTSTTTSSTIFSSIDEDCTRLVFSFLDGKEVMRQRMLNRFAAAFLPSCILCLTVEVSQLAQGLASNSFMLRLTNLEQLVVHKAGALSLSPAVLRVGSATTPLYAWDCAELPTNQAIDGESAVLALAGALSSGIFPNLKKLQLNSVFVDTMSHNGLFPLCKALESGCCPLLEDLLLAGNNLGDLGAYGVARLLQSSSSSTSYSFGSTT
ncbi:unnamed protein product [Peronospora destructor]|uniref:Uncharacterized protein n=1 Tax=Peronospora destructor TaxID=86335 RepID=A0AAV0VCN3_9STRA|nr:unnamed protein product [Peronospora destructor]